MKHTLYLIPLLAVIGLLSLRSDIIVPIEDNLLPELKIKGVCWVAGDSIVSSNLDSLIINNSEWISQTTFAWQQGHDNPSIKYDNSRSWWGERDAGLIHTTKLAHQKGIKVMLKPHIWLSRSDGKWRSDIKMNSQEDWDKWFSDYKEMIMHYAKVAELGKIDALCIGTELLIPSTKHPDKWRDIIHSIRQIYSGQLTYAANFYKEYEKVTFWDDLDYIGVQAYFPLTNKKNPSVKALRKSWRKHIKNLISVSKKYNKKIVFTEVGYKNTADSAIEPWVWPRNINFETVELSDKVQAECYEAMFAELWDEKWFGGVFIWKWFHGTHAYSYQEYQVYSRERRARRMKERGIVRAERPNVGFTPQGKLAERVMRKYFSESY